MVLGFPQQIRSYAHLGQSGVDELDTLELAYKSDASASLTCSMRRYKPREAFIAGSLPDILTDSPSWKLF